MRVKRRGLGHPGGACILLLVLIPEQCLSDANSMEGQWKQDPVHQP